jgi:transcriptional regulator with XRE-family HTH domain
MAILLAMSYRTPSIFPREERLSAELGERLRLARRRRNISVETMAARVGVTRTTLRYLEQGRASVSLSVLLRTLSVLGLENDLEQIAAKDDLGVRLAERALKTRAGRTANAAEEVSQP